MQHIVCPGFKAAGVAAGLKKEGIQDLGMLYSEVPATVAGVFTRNRVKAAPVLLDRERVRAGTCRALIVNSGNANCCTGPQGMRDARHMTSLAAAGLQLPPEQVLVSSTGVIGERLPMDRIKAAVPDLTAALSADGIPDLARAIMTTDTFAKAVSRQGRINGRTFTVTAVAKGSGMIRPDMATMLCFVCSDVKAAAGDLQTALGRAVDGTLNCLTIDGDTSTNDTVLLMANGLSGAVASTADQVEKFETVLGDVLGELARMLVKDGEGATKLVAVAVRGAGSDADARRVADTVAHSNLVKTALFGEDANWGRILAAAGRAGVDLDPDTVDLYFDGVQMVARGCGCGREAEAEATRVLKLPEFKIVLDLNLGTGSATVLTCDFSIDYVKINADYRT